MLWACGQRLSSHLLNAASGAANAGSATRHIVPAANSTAAVKTRPARQQFIEVITDVSNTGWSTTVAAFANETIRRFRALTTATNCAKSQII
jgi:hypothetical protein